MPNPENISRGEGKTKTPRVYAGCVPCGTGHVCADIEHANIWIVNHWKRCRRSFRDSEGRYTLSPELTGSSKGQVRVKPELRRGRPRASKPAADTEQRTAA
jgi:hypothetical protein